MLLCKVSHDFKIVMSTEYITMCCSIVWRFFKKMCAKMCEKDRENEYHGSLFHLTKLMKQVLRQEVRRSDEDGRAVCHSRMAGDKTQARTYDVHDFQPISPWVEIRHAHYPAVKHNYCDSKRLIRRDSLRFRSNQPEVILWLKHTDSRQLA